MLIIQKSCEVPLFFLGLNKSAATMPPYVPSNENTTSLVKCPRDKATEEAADCQVSTETASTTVSPPRALADVTPWDKIKKIFTYETPLIWENIIAIGLYHVVAIVGFLMFWWTGGILTILFGLTMGGIGGFGVTAGVHRHWCHRAYKAKLPLKIILMLSYSVAGQNTIYDWVRDHRVHHKFSETDADPHNANRGFFFSHVGWLMMRKHPEVLKKGRTIDMSDILEDPVVQFHQKHFRLMKMLCCFIIPTLIPVYLWNETWTNAIVSQALVRYIANLNFTWFVNSLAHMYGSKPFDKRISPVENKIVAFLAMGEGWHNYHHAFPWDYKAAELGNYSLNVTTFWIDQFAKIGWAYDLKQPSKDLIMKVVKATGDGSHPEFGHEEYPDTSENVTIMNKEKEY